MLSIAITNLKSQVSITSRIACTVTDRFALNNNNTADIHRNIVFLLPMQLFCLQYLLPLSLIPVALSKTVTITAAPSIPSKVPQYVSDKLFTSVILNSTNFFRSEHDAVPVTYNKTLQRFASRYLASNPSCHFAHSGGPYGENIALGYADVRSAVDAWGNERKEYDFSKPGFDHETGHFTQLVWKNTTAVGCGRKLCGTRGWFIACEYWPRGNILGKFDQQVGRQTNVAGIASIRPHLRTLMWVMLGILGTISWMW